MNTRVLFVDDERNVLDAIRRQLRSKFELETAQGPTEGMAAISERGPFAVVVSDLRMPGLDGIQFLARVREMAPDTVRMMLTGNADLQTAIHAVNKGNIFQFLTKPCSSDVLARALSQGLNQYRLVTGEKELLNRTLKGCIEALTGLLALVSPEALGRSSRIGRYVKDLAYQLEIEQVWELEMAALLSQIGWIAVPSKTLEKFFAGEELEAEEAQAFRRHPVIASDVVRAIPRMEEVARIIMYQEKRFDGSGPPDNSLSGEALPLGSRILKVALDFDLLETQGLGKTAALQKLKSRQGWYDPKVVTALETHLAKRLRYTISTVSASQLEAGMILAEDIKSAAGQLLISRGQELNELICQRLSMFARTAGVIEPIRVFAPLET